MNDLDKRRILARAFFTDNPDDYEDYHEALTEFMNKGNVSNEFIDFGVKPVIENDGHHRLFVNDVGHVLSVRNYDKFISPRTSMTPDEGYELQETTQTIADENPYLDEYQVFS